MTDAEFKECLALAEAKRARLELEHVKRELADTRQRADTAERQLARTTEDQLDCEATNAEINAENDRLRAEVDRLRAEIRRMTGCSTAADLDAERERVATLDRLQSERDHAIAEQGRLEDEGDQLLAEIERLTAALNTPVTEDFSRGVEAEAAHQRERWGSEHDAGKRPEDWIALCVYLLGKATKAHYENDRDKYLHHLISTAAVLANAHLNATGRDTRMRPGVAGGAT